MFGFIVGLGAAEILILGLVGAIVVVLIVRATGSKKRDQD